MYFTTCPLCGAHLDPCEKCGCLEEKEKLMKKAKIISSKLCLKRAERVVKV